MRQQDNQMASAISLDVDVADLTREELESDLAGLFPRRESRAHAMSYIRGLCSDLPRKNGWTIAEWAGDERPDGKQRLLYRSKWDEKAVRDGVRAFAARHLADPDAGLVFDETGQEKGGRHTAGVGGQYTGTAGKITNAIVAVYTTYASRHGHCLIDGDLYAQKGWFTDPERFALAGFDPGHAFRTKPEIALEQAERALAAGLPVAWAAADEVYGRSSKFRQFFEKRDIAYVVAVGVDFQVATAAGAYRADLLARKIPPKSWNRLSCGQGSKGPRVYDWAMVATASPRHVPLIRRSVANPDDLAFFYAFVPDGQVNLSRIIDIAGYRWMVEEDFQQSKGQAGLDHAQVRRYRSWLRHAVLAIAALAIQAMTAAKRRKSHPEPVLPAHGDDDPPDDYGLIALTVPEVHRLFMLQDELRDLPAPIARRRADFRLRWSNWRRRHQARARWFHHRARLARLTW
jgi:SRSO17 transposase